MLPSAQDRANAIKLLVRVLEPLMETVPEVALVNFSGGDKHNAIPREAFATVALSNMDNLGGTDAKPIVTYMTFQFGVVDGKEVLSGVSLFFSSVLL